MIKIKIYVKKELNKYCHYIYHFKFIVVEYHEITLLSLICLFKKIFDFTNINDNLF